MSNRFAVVAFGAVAVAAGVAVLLRPDAPPAQTEDVGLPKHKTTADMPAITATMPAATQPAAAATDITDEGIGPVQDQPDKVLQLDPSEMMRLEKDQSLTPQEKAERSRQLRESMPEIAPLEPAYREQPGKQ